MLTLAASGKANDWRHRGRSSLDRLSNFKRAQWAGFFIELVHTHTISKWAIFGKQNWRRGMNRKRGYGAQLRANLDPTKGVD
jgi:hypothetical protein